MIFKFKTQINRLCQLKVWIITLLLCLFFEHVTSGQYSNSVFSSDIKTVRLHKLGWETSTPILKLGTADQLLFSFDDLSGNSETYNYAIIHCTPDWEETGLNTTEYVDGFPTNQLLNYKYSYSATYRYVHYELQLPNSDISFKLSGNYIIKVTKAGDDKPIITRRFYVVDNRVTISPTVKLSHNPNLIDTHQEVNFSIFYPDLKIDNPREDIKVVVQQNGREDNKVTNLLPQFIRPNELVYDYTTESSFEATNEFRWLDIRTFKYLSERTIKIDYFDPFYHVTITPDFTRDYSSYFLREDFEGQYVIMVKDRKDPALEADYAFVHLTVPLDAPFVKSTSLHAIGEGFGWMPTPENAFQYNFGNHCYELSVLLKQGVYDYVLGVKEEDSKVIDFKRFEGNYRMTENNYTIFVYLKGISDNYSQLIGVEIAHSFRNGNNL